MLRVLLWPIWCKPFESEPEFSMKSMMLLSITANKQAGDEVCPFFKKEKN